MNNPSKQNEINTNYLSEKRRIRMLVICFLAYFAYLFIATVYEQYDLISSIRENPQLWDAVGYRLWMVIVPVVIALLFWKEQLVGWILMVGISLVLLLGNVLRTFSLIRVFAVPDLSHLYLFHQTFQPIIGIVMAVTLLRFTYRPSLQAIFKASKEQFWLVVGIVVVLIVGRLVI